MDNWNPIDKFWGLFYPLFNPQPDASPSRLSSPAPIWDLPSPYGNIHHPDNQEAIPHFVNPGYYEKLSMTPEHEVIHMDPPAWMIISNLSALDWFGRIPAVAASGPAFTYALAHQRGIGKPSLYQVFSTAVVGAACGFAIAFSESESRLQGYIRNEKDVMYWKNRALHDRQVLSGQIDPLLERSILQQSVQSLFGPAKHDLGALEKEYYRH